MRPYHQSTSSCQLRSLVQFGPGYISLPIFCREVSRYRCQIGFREEAQVQSSSTTTLALSGIGGWDAQSSILALRPLQLASKAGGSQRLTCHAVMQAEARQAIHAPANYR